MYAKLPDEPTIYFDVDDTLILWNCPPEEGEEYQIVQYKANRIKMVPHIPHIKLLKQHFNENKKIVVWSQGGADWAEAVILHLGLENYVHAIMSKPTEYVDDLHSYYFMGKPTWLNPNRKNWDVSQGL